MLEPLIAQVPGAQSFFELAACSIQCLPHSALYSKLFYVSKFSSLQLKEQRRQESYLLLSCPIVQRASQNPCLLFDYVGDLCWTSDIKAHAAVLLLDECGWRRQGSQAVPFSIPELWPLGQRLPSSTMGQPTVAPVGKAIHGGGNWQF